MRYYAVAYFSKFIPKGSVKISTEKNINDVIKTVEEKDGAENITLMKYGMNCVSYLTPDNKLVTVAVNEGVERKIDFNADANCMSIYITTQENQMFAYENLEVQEFSIPAESITTTVFENKERCLIKSVSLFLYGDIANYRLQLYFALLQSYIISCEKIFANNFKYFLKKFVTFWSFDSSLYTNNGKKENKYMVFSSLQFILIFMPIFFICYYLAPNRYRNIVLLMGSLAFYFVGTINTPYHFILFISSILTDFSIGLCIEKHPKYKKAFLISGIVFHLICLCIFKYTNFILSELGKIYNGFNFFEEIILPIGISFYTFQGISYIADVYKGKIQSEKSLLKFTVYISMFAQLIAGPIVTYGEISDQLEQRKINRKLVFNGIGIFIFGLGLKVLLANPLGKLWSQAQAIGFESLSTPLAWMSVIAFSFQLYFDFFGYSLMAIGLGEMLGFKLPINFKHPYTSVTMTEFWRRWHITLGSWFREYVYIPLGGNRKGIFRTIMNLLIGWLLTGIWHGAGYNFLLWGFVLFLIIVTEKLWTGKFFNKHRVIGHIYMLFLIPLTWSVFAVNDIRQLGVLFARLFPFFGQGVWSIFRYDYLKYLGQYYPFFIVGILLSTKLPYRLLKQIKNKIIISIFLAVILAGSLYCMYRGFDDPFLYFRF